MIKFAKNSQKFAAGILVLALSGFAFAQEEGEVLGEYGAITVKYLNGKRTAVLDSASKATVEITEDVEIDSVYYNRDYSSEWGKPGTLVLPFTIDGQGGGCFSQFAQIYEMTNISMTGKNTWQIDVQEQNEKTGIMVANRPYFVRPYAKNLQIDKHCLSKDKPTVMNTVRDADNMVVALDKWEFRGMYTYKQWNEGDKDLGYVYGFAARAKEVDNKQIQQGQFVKGKAGVYIRPLRAYLFYNANSVSEKGTKKSRALAKEGEETATLTADDLPSTIDVVFHDKDGGTIAIHSLNPRTGEFTTNSTGWYDMKGRKLGKKPTISGNYFYNGKKVTIK